MILATRAIFEGLIIDEKGDPVSVAHIGQEAFYVIDDAGFMRHIPSQDVDRQIWDQMTQHITGNESMLSEQAAKMLGQEDIFTVAMIQNQLNNIDKQFDSLQQTGIPEDSRTYLGMMGFRAIINLHGDLVSFNQPGIVEEE
jgi:hypothetical protein